jgi:hypothetical protein
LTTFTSLIKLATSIRSSSGPRLLVLKRVKESFHSTITPLDSSAGKLRYHRNMPSVTDTGKNLWIASSDGDLERVKVGKHVRSNHIYLGSLIPSA